jgi:hypothetical protein
MQVFFAVSIWDRFFQLLPQWMLVTAILVIGLSSPVTFMLDNISGARIYEAAVAGAQFFLMGGFLAAFSAWAGKMQAWKFFLAGVLWALAVGTRQTVVLAVGFMTLMLAISILKSDHPLSQKVKNFSMLILPLAMGAVCLGWYNWARFGSITETGLYYQMNHGFVHYRTDELMGYKYIFQNIYNYLFLPFGMDSKFPFLYPLPGSREEIFFFSKTPSIYGSQIITGLFYTVPFIVFSSVPFLMPRAAKNSSQDKERTLLNWIAITLAGAALASFGFLLIFFWAAMRYAEDFMPSLILLSVIGFWQGYSHLLNKPMARRLYAAAGVLLAGTSIIVSTLLAVSINDARLILIRFFSGG